MNTKGTKHTKGTTLVTVVDVTIMTVTDPNAVANTDPPKTMMTKTYTLCYQLVH